MRIVPHNICDPAIPLYSLYKGIALKNRRIKYVENRPIFRLGLSLTKHHTQMLSNTIRMSLYKDIAVKNRRIKIVESRRIKNVENTPYYSHSITNALQYYSHIYPCKGIAVKNRRVKNVESGPIFHMGLLCTEHHRCSSVQFTSLFACLSIRVSQ